MEKWKELEFSYAKRLRESSKSDRVDLYTEAYSAVVELSVRRFTSDAPVGRTAGTSAELVQKLAKIVEKNDHVLEIGCGRGYTCLKLATYVKSMVGIDVSEPSVSEAISILAKAKIKNVHIRQASAMDLTDHFSLNEFDVCISIDVFEHLHPDDAEEHLRQVFKVLKPGGKYIIIMPNRLSGPHDITREEFPEAKEALGFHLNETTYIELIRIMRKIGYNKFRLFKKSLFSKKEPKPLIIPSQFAVLGELFYRYMPSSSRIGILRRLISIRLIANKPK